MGCNLTLQHILWKEINNYQFNVFATNRRMGTYT
ncbi:hypothetical protein CLV98_107136 [Dyadobacter jejuensis]|uniref:Uncharacterized protein n=1 Tax=Dyadobacter jejuensis TaxID=1082580 RepID=A0A316AJD7_9BACT|nr:hypothetical protein CLV98_107136 [Dyadobacter jejuensis]